MPDPARVMGRVKLRPTRLALLTRPSDISSIRRFLEISTTLWGGTFNNIIPVMRMRPKIWSRDILDSENLNEVVRGYVRFYEPDMFVEAKAGILEKAGLSKLRVDHKIYPRVIELSSVISNRLHSGRIEPTCGLSILDVMQESHRREQRFALKESRNFLYVKPKSACLVSEILFGCYPKISEFLDLAAGYKDIFEAQVCEATPETWRKVFIKGAGTPLRLTQFDLQMEKAYRGDLTVFVFDPANPLDCIDVWNARTEGRPVLPVPSTWIEELSDDLRHVLRSEVRTAGGDSQGEWKQYPIIQYGRSLADDECEKITQLLSEGQEGRFAQIKSYKDAVWRPQSGRNGVRQSVYAQEKSFDVPLEQAGQRYSCRVTGLAPRFAAEYGPGDNRWMNVVSFLRYGQAGVATLLPFNIFQPEWPRIIGGDLTIGTEGWKYAHQWLDFTNYISFLSKVDAVISSFSLFGISAELSEPGYIAKQTLDHLNGFYGLRLLKDEETLRLLNEMAGGFRSRGGGDVQEFDGRSRPYSDWVGLVARRTKRSKLDRVSLEQFTDAGVIQLGCETQCTVCRNYNWHSLEDVSYDVRCERCRQVYKFPQGFLKSRNGNFHFKAIGPFAIPDYARGSYTKER